MEPLGDLGGGAAGEPGDAPGLVNRARERLAQGDYAAAVADCTRALQLDPHFVEAFLVRGTARQGQGYLDRAAADFERALQANPREPRTYLLRAKLRLAEDRLDLAREDYDRALEVDPNNAAAYTARAQIRASQGDTAGAAADCDRALLADPRNADAYLTRAAARWQQNDLDGGLADCDEAIRLAPDNARAYLLRGNLRQAREDDAGAEADYLMAVRLDPSLAETLRAQGYEPEAAAPGPPALASPDPAGDVILPAPGEEGAARPAPTGYGGARSWVTVAGAQAALAGLFFGAVLNRSYAGAILALLVFVPLFLAIFLGRYAGARRAVLGGLVLAVVAILAYGIGGPERPFPLLLLRAGDPLGTVAWLLGWGAFGGLLFVFAGASGAEAVAGYLKGGLPRAFAAARTGAVAGILLGAALGGLYLVVPGFTAGAVVGGVAGVLLGGAAGNDPWFIPLVLLGIGLGGFAGAEDLTALYQVLGAGVTSALYWTVAGALVGLLAGASVGSRAPRRVAGGPFLSRLFGVSLPARLLEQNPIAAAQGLNLGVGLLVGVGGLFLGGAVGLVAGSVLGALAALPQAFAGLETDEPLPWVVTGAGLGIVFSGLFANRVAPYEGPQTTGSTVTLASSPRALPLVLVGLAGALIGAGVAGLAWAAGLFLGGVVYWVLAGAGTGAVIGAKLWSVMVK